MIIEISQLLLIVPRLFRSESALEKDNPYLFVWETGCATHVKISHLLASLRTSRQKVVSQCLSQIVNK
jgi:hypothetical protein